MKIEYFFNHENTKFYQNIILFFLVLIEGVTKKSTKNESLDSTFSESCLKNLAFSSKAEQF